MARSKYSLLAGFTVFCLFFAALFFSMNFSRCKVVPIKDGIYNEDDDLKKRTTIAQLRVLAASIRIYVRLHGTYPIPDSNLCQIFDREGISYGGLNSSMLPMTDCWDGVIKYVVNSNNATLTSAGVDRTFDSLDDLTYVMEITNGCNTIWELVEEIEWSKSRVK